VPCVAAPGPPRARLQQREAGPGLPRAAGPIRHAGAVGAEGAACKCVPQWSRAALRHIGPVLGDHSNALNQYTVQASSIKKVHAMQKRLLLLLVLQQTQELLSLLLLGRLFRNFRRYWVLGESNSHSESAGETKTSTRRV